MIVPVVLGFYIFICISVVLFNCWKLISGKLLGWRFRQRKRWFWRCFLQQARNWQALPEHRQELQRSRMARRLRRSGSMMAFHSAMDEIHKQLPRQYEVCLPFTAGIVQAVLPYYAGKAGMKQAYYSFLVTRFQLMRYAPSERLTAFLLDQVREEKGLYNLENALRAIYSSNQPPLVLEALRALDGADDIFIHEKLLVDGLLTFEDRDGLIALLWQCFSSFGSQMQGLLLDYIRFASGAWRDQMLSLAQGTQELEVKIACLRYFGRYPDERMRTMLYQLAADANAAEWELCAVCMMVLAAYPGEATIALLKGGLRSRNWYVRYNAALSLRSLNVGVEQVLDVLEGDDRYAREMLQYRLELRPEELAAAQAAREAEIRAEAATEPSPEPLFKALSEPLSEPLSETLSESPAEAQPTMDGKRKKKKNKKKAKEKAKKKDRKRDGASSVTEEGEQP